MKKQILEQTKRQKGQGGTLLAVVAFSIIVLAIVTTFFSNSLDRINLVKSEFSKKTTEQIMRLAMTRMANRVVRGLEDNTQWTITDAPIGGTPTFDPGGGIAPGDAFGNGATVSSTGTPELLEVFRPYGESFDGMDYKVEYFGDLATMFENHSYPKYFGITLKTRADDGTSQRMRALVAAGVGNLGDYSMVVYNQQDKITLSSASSARVAINYTADWEDDTEPQMFVTNEFMAGTIQLNAPETNPVGTSFFGLADGVVDAPNLDNTPILYESAPMHASDITAVDLNPTVSTSSALVHANDSILKSRVVYHNDGRISVEAYVQYMTGTGATFSPPDEGAYFDIGAAPHAMDSIGLNRWLKENSYIERIKYEDWRENPEDLRHRRNLVSSVLSDWVALPRMTLGYVGGLDGGGSSGGDQMHTIDDRVYTVFSDGSDGGGSGGSQWSAEWRPVVNKVTPADFGSRPVVRLDADVEVVSDNGYLGVNKFEAITFHAHEGAIEFKTNIKKADPSATMAWRSDSPSEAAISFTASLDSNNDPINGDARRHSSSNYWILDGALMAHNGGIKLRNMSDAIDNGVFSQTGGLYVGKLPIFGGTSDAGWHGFSQANYIYDEEFQNNLPVALDTRSNNLNFAILFINKRNKRRTIAREIASIGGQTHVFNHLDGSYMPFEDAIQLGDAFWNDYLGL